MVIKAIHFEIVSEMTTDGFMAVLRRFIARRGIPTHIYSDNGTNFVGANNQLKEIYALFNSEEHKNCVYFSSLPILVLIGISYHHWVRTSVDYGNLW